MPRKRPQGSLENEGQGIYLLFLRRELVYVGKSRDPQSRIQTHRRNGRPFDYAIAIPTPAGDEHWIETALIKAFKTGHNRAGIPGREGSSIDLPVEIHEVRVIERVVDQPTVIPKDPKPLNTRRARDMAGKHYLQREFDEAVRTGAINFVWRDPGKQGPTGRRLFRADDVKDWIARAELARFGGELQVEAG